MTNPYVELASEVTAQPEVMQSLADWFDSDNARSAFPFGEAVGRSDAEGKVADAVASWMKDSRCPDIVAGYLCGMVARLGELPLQWRERLDQVAEHHADYAAMLTFRVDQTHSGFDRIMRLVRLGKIESRSLRGFHWMAWLALLNNREKMEVLNFLREVGNKDQPEAVAVALDLITWWTDYGKKPLVEDFLPSILELLKQSIQVRVDPGHWTIIARLLAVSYPGEVADIVLKTLTSAWPCKFAVEEESAEILREIAALHPRQVMDAIGRTLKDAEKRAWLSFVRLPGLFESIGRETTHEWIHEHGTEYVKYIAPHLDSPQPQDGSPYLPPVTEWLFTEFEQDDEVFRCFCSGRHNIETRWGHARDQRAELEKSLEPFMNHPLRRVRQWAEYELQFNEEESRIDDVIDERRERL